MVSIRVTECLLEPLRGIRFVGGYYQAEDGHEPFVMLPDGRASFSPVAPLRLDLAKGTFVGLELGQFKSIAEGARRGTDALSNLRALDRYPFVYSAISFLRDGSIIGPAEMFRPITPATF